MDYKETLNLPKTDFPMKANLTQREPEILAQWEKEDLYGEIRKQFKGKPKFVFHDGPPYANGHIHMGHALNKILKDFIVKYMTMQGFDATFIPGWDCHGLPIEHQVTKAQKEKKLTPSKNEIRKLCREYAAGFVQSQKEEFVRLGVFGDWNRPYLTMDYSYEATIVREFGKFVMSGQVYQGMKPVHWCTSCRTALAEAEVEYADRSSSSIYVKFPLKSKLPPPFAELDADKTFFVIWTTTPWTLPANLAVCLHPDFQYVAVAVDGQIYIVAEDRLPALVLEWDIAEYKILATCEGKDLENAVCRHPFIDRDSLVILGDHVTLEQGTGCVHTAPGHGQEDYVVGNKYGLETYNPVDDAGVFVPEVEHFGGQFVAKANPAIIEKLREDGFLVGAFTINHSYPHCWRCHQPIIFRATRQWFISMDKEGLREKALEAIQRVKWIPKWGKERIYNMVENRPDWCVSRQRAWGVPIAIFSCSVCEEILLSEEVFKHIVDLVEQHGADFWFEKEADELLPPGVRCACGGEKFVKENDILDVWFDSGVSHAAVVENNPDLQWPADLYLEGSDQHRGWFHSSLLESVGTRGKEPYKTALTHGYVVDGKGKKMSKSAGNVIAPQKIIDQFGAEVLRLWVASENYREDIRLSQEILKRLTEAYRKIRNTYRFLLGNLSDFDPQKDMVPHEQLMEIDRYILHRFKLLVDKIMKAYDEYEFHVFYQSFYSFCVVDLSAFYLDIIKDRLYTYPRTSRERRSGQTALYILLRDMTRLMAPILSFTAEEIWSYMPAGGVTEKSVHQSLFPDASELNLEDDVIRKWEMLVVLKGEVSKALEHCRREKVIGHSLDAVVQLVLPKNIRTLLNNDFEELKFIFIVSKVEVVDSLDNESGVTKSDVLEGVQVLPKPMGGQKCERCWNYFLEIVEGTEHTSICPRCIKNLQATVA
ncbi:MAG: isoleucine--tRNA ligase [Nitrospinae bacterium]|jgi:isoleucyl-tRNA synthetase|nr:isoleucine--tRNA ligase [Nitrospinota bacterium]MDA1109129.1 isoleucine--tRNA ligase [Nitrospinota bacterium]